MRSNVRHCATVLQYSTHFHTKPTASVLAIHQDPHIPNLDANHVAVHLGTTLRSSHHIKTLSPPFGFRFSISVRENVFASLLSRCRACPSSTVGPIASAGASSEPYRRFPEPLRFPGRRWGLWRDLGDSCGVSGFWSRCVMGKVGGDGVGFGEVEEEDMVPLKHFIEKKKNVFLLKKAKGKLRASGADGELLSGGEAGKGDGVENGVSVNVEKVGACASENERGNDCGEKGVEWD
ncbi:hypothetical protein Syun_007369 [Stephania yunnanensis]|uniref:Uncharacterized protein n=1 Tax=Stephania yunnanensis TaxID=152371 RepID=A0AAP0KZV4_9MAGN